MKVCTDPLCFAYAEEVKKESGYAYMVTIPCLKKTLTPMIFGITLPKQAGDA